MNPPSSLDAAVHARASSTISRDATNCALNTCWATTPTISARTHRPRTSTLPRRRGNTRGAPISTSVPTARAADARSSPMRRRYPSVTATSVRLLGAGSRPVTTVMGSVPARARSKPATVSRNASLVPRTGRASTGLDSSGTTLRTCRSARMRRNASASRSRWRPGFGLSVSSADGPGAAAATWIPDSGPPLESWLSTRVRAEVEMMRSALRSAAARATASTVSTARPARRPSDRSAAIPASDHVMPRRLGRRGAPRRGRSAGRRGDRG